MIIWINGAFGSGKTTTAYELNRRLPGSFVYDPENVGFFIRRNAPSEFSKGDFQDFPLWREMNYQTISLIASRYAGALLIPMTLVNPEYYSEIIGRLEADGWIYGISSSTQANKKYSGGSGSEARGFSAAITSRLSLSTTALMLLTTTLPE